MKPSCVLLAFFVLCLSCKKDKDVAITKDTIAGTYGFVKITFKPDGGGNEVEVTDAYMLDCALDDLQVFETDGKYTYDDAGVQCGGGDDISTWNLNSTTSISIDGTAYELTSFNGSVMVISQVTDHLGVDGKLKTHLKKQ